MVDTPPKHASSILGEVREAGGGLMFLYHRASYAREYLFDEAQLRRLRSCQDFPKELAGTLHRLRLINSRNRLTDALVQTMLVSQSEYLRSGETLSLLPLTQAQMSARAESAAGAFRGGGCGPHLSSGAWTIDRAGERKNDSTG